MILEFRTIVWVGADSKRCHEQILILYDRDRSRIDGLRHTPVDWIHRGFHQVRFFLIHHTIAGWIKNLHLSFKLREDFLCLSDFFWSGFLDLSLGV